MVSTEGLWKDAMQKGRDRMAQVADKLSHNEPLNAEERYAVFLLLQAMQNTSCELPEVAAIWDMTVHFGCENPIKDSDLPPKIRLCENVEAD